MGSILNPTKGRDQIADENTPLLIPGGADSPNQISEALTQPSSTTEGNNDDENPLPKLQIALLCYCRLVEPIAFFSIFPFINKMIWETGNLNEGDVGFYAGLIVGFKEHFMRYEGGLISGAGIAVFIDADVGHDPVGSRSRQTGEETGAGRFVGGSDCCDSAFWIEYADLANDPV
jgi:hypothetical protein